MKKIYIASPMFSEAELIFNEQLAISLEKIGLDVFLPQRSGYRLIELMETMSAEDAKMVIFNKDFEAVKNCDIVLIVLDGRTIDEGACVELGFGYATGKLCYGLKTDPRTMINGQINPMITGCLKHTFDSVDSIIKHFNKSE